MWIFEKSSVKPRFFINSIHNSLMNSITPILLTITDIKAAQPLWEISAEVIPDFIGDQSHLRIL